MEIPVLSPSFRLRVYLTNYVISVPLLVAMLASSGGEREPSLFGDIMWWGFMFVLFAYSILMPVWSKIWGASSMRFRIDHTGVTYIKRKTSYYMKWDDVQYIILYPDAYGRITKNCYICFFSDKTRPTLTKKGFKEGAFGVQWRKGLEEIIREYTDKPILGIASFQGRGSEGS